MLAALVRSYALSAQVRAIVLAAAVVSAGCTRQPDQWLVSVATDAPVPQFGDHLVLEVVGANADCQGCLRIIGIDGTSSFPVSFGVEPQTGSGEVRVRARLYRAEQAGPDGLPASPALIDAVGHLPALSGETPVAFNLSMKCFGVPSDLTGGQTCDPTTGMRAPEPVLPVLSASGTQPVAGTWGPAQPAHCNGAAPTGMVCVQGGAFILGQPKALFAADQSEEPLPEHLVQLSPFALDATEVTVGAVRALAMAGKLSSQPLVKDTTSTQTEHAACTYLGKTDTANDALPVNCISRDQADAICKALGKRLPSEAEWEYAAGNLGNETPYPWGSSIDLCTLAVIGMGRTLTEAPNLQFPEDSSCRKSHPQSPWGPAAGGSSTDVTSLQIHDLAGSMIEWMADTFAAYDAPCWQPTMGNMLVDPVCTTPAPGTMALGSVRGSAWGFFKLDARATARSEAEPTGADPYTGVRCAQSM